MPSASTWFMTMTRPVPPPARPVTNVADHSGRDRGSGSPVPAAATSSSARSSPGGGQGSCQTWCRRSNAGSSAQDGLRLWRLTIAAAAAAMQIAYVQP